MTAGSITFSTALDNAQLEKELSRLKKDIAKLEVDTSVKTNQKSILTAQLEEAKKEYLDLQQKMREFKGLSGSEFETNPEAGKITARMQELDKCIVATESEIEKTELEIGKMNTKLGAAKETYGEISQNAEHLKRTAEAERRLQETLNETSPAEIARQEAEQRLLNIKENAVVADQHIVDIQRELAGLAARRAELERASVGVGHEEYDQILQRTSEINNELREYQNGLLRGAEDADEAANGANRMGDAVSRANDYMDRFLGRIKKLASRVFVFTLITTALRALRTWMGKTVKSNDEAAAAIAKLKGALLTLAQPLVNVVIPAFITLVNVLTRVVSTIANIVSKLFGSTIQSSQEAAKGLYNEMEALEGVGAAAEDAGKSMASFDEINQVGDTGGSGSGGSSGGSIAPNFDSSFIEGELDRIAFLVGGALLAVGAILTFSGINIPLGISLMATGALALASAVTTNWDAVVEMLRGPVGKVVAIVSGALLAIGSLLLFSGVNIPLGLGLVAVGVAGLATMAAVNWDSVSTALQGPLGAIAGLIGGALLVIGAMLAFSGASIPMGLGLMMIGALGLATAIAANWDTVQNALNGPVGAVVAIVSGALIAIGAILCFSGAAIPLGIGLIAAGAIGLATSIAANWETIQNKLEGPIGIVTGLISTALLVIGAILTFTGANIPLGLGLLAAGALGLAASISANWETIQTALQGPLGAVVGMVSAALLALGAILLFTGAFIPLGLGLIAVGAVGLATTLFANWETVQNALGGPIGAVTALVSGALLVLGVILLFTGVGIPLGLGLIAAGAAGLAAVVVPNWDFIFDAIKNAWTNVKNFWNTHIAKFFTSDYWSNLGSVIIDGFLSGLKRAWEAVASWAAGVVEWFTGLFKGAEKSATSVTKAANGISTQSAVSPVSTYGRVSAAFSAQQLSMPQIPKLAQGAVIPPNREFLAVLGDQRRGTNIEAPADLIRQIVREETGGGDRTTALLQAILMAIKEGKTIEVDRREFGRVVHRANVEESRRVGINFAG